MKILFHGDSITDGNRGRNDDPNHILGHGYVFSIASQLGAENPELEFVNKGWGGWRIGHLLANWQPDVIDQKPDVVSLLIGTNDSRLPNMTPERYETILRMLVEDLPTAKFVLCEPFRYYFDPDDPTVPTRKINIPGYQKAVKKVAEETGSIFVPLQKVFDEAQKLAPITRWIWDGCHPTVYGHHLIARQWLKCTAELWKR